MIDINTVEIGQRVRIDGEEGVVQRIEHGMIWVEFALPNGETDLMDIDPYEPGLELII